METGIERPGASSQNPIKYDESLDNVKKIRYPTLVLENELPMDLEPGDKLFAGCHFVVKEVSRGQISGDGRMDGYRLVMELVEIMPDKPSNKGLPQNRQVPHIPGTPFKG